MYPTRQGEFVLSVKSLPSQKDNKFSSHAHEAHDRISNTEKLQETNIKRA